MFSRSAIKQTAWAALLAVLFVVLLPAALNASGSSSVLAALTSICTLDGAKLNTQQSPDQQPSAVAHKPCLFCTSSVPLFAEVGAPRVVAVVEGIPVLVGPSRAEALPPDVAATQPLSPRAPPRPY